MVFKEKRLYNKKRNDKFLQLNRGSRVHSSQHQIAALGQLITTVRPVATSMKSENSGGKSYVISTKSLALKTTLLLKLKQFSLTEKYSSK